MTMSGANQSINAVALLKKIFKTPFPVRVAPKSEHLLHHQHNQ